MEKTLPYSKEAERAVLAAALDNGGVARRVVNELQSEMFYFEDHRDIFEAIRSIEQAGDYPDSVAVTGYLKGAPNQRERPWASMLSAMMSELPFVPNVDTYIKMLKGKYTLRQVAVAGMQIAQAGYDESDPEAALELLRSKALEVMTGSGESNAVSDFSTALKDGLDFVETRVEAGGGILGVPTGFAKMDEILTGLQKGDLIIIAARPSVGKTAMALNIAANAAIRNNIPTLVCSLEMSKEQLVQRLISSEALVDGQRLRMGDLGQGDWERIARCVGGMKSAPIYIVEGFSSTIGDIRAAAQRTKATKGLGLVIIDYLQLINTKGRTENRQQEVAAVTRGLKAMARELNVPVVCLAQVSRQVDQSGDGLPKLSHLKESGEIEQAADVVMFIHRETDEKKLEDNPELKREVKLIVAKQRNGPVGDFQLGWRREFVRYVDI